MSESKNQHYRLHDLHAYVVPISPKMLKETLSVVQSALNELERARPGYNAGGPVPLHQERIQVLIDECSRMRPTGPDGKHGNLHTPECGCKTK